MEKPTYVDDWLNEGNLARAGKVEQFSTVYIPVNVNIFVVGLDGTGNLGVKIASSQLKEWLEHLDHTVPHRIVDMNAPLTGSNAEKGGPSPLAHTHHANAADIVYRYNFRLVETSPKVLDVVERYLNQHHRPIDPTDSLGELGSNNPEHKLAHQVDPEGLVALLEDLVGFLRATSTLTHTVLRQALEGDKPDATSSVMADILASQREPPLTEGYNIFVLNPKSNWSVDPSQFIPGSVHYKFSRYGYRVGFSNAEIDELLKMKLPAHVPSPGGMEPPPEPWGGVSNPPPPPPPPPSYAGEHGDDGSWHIDDTNYDNLHDYEEDDYSGYDYGLGEGAASVREGNDDFGEFHDSSENTESPVGSDAEVDDATPHAYESGEDDEEEYEYDYEDVEEEDEESEESDESEEKDLFDGLSRKEADELRDIMGNTEPLDGDDDQEDHDGTDDPLNDDHNEAEEQQPAGASRRLLQIGGASAAGGAMGSHDKAHGNGAGAHEPPPSPLGNKRATSIRTQTQHDHDEAQYDMQSGTDDIEGMKAAGGSANAGSAKKHASVPHIPLNTHGHAAGKQAHSHLPSTMDPSEIAHHTLSGVSPPPKVAVASSVSARTTFTENRRGLPADREEEEQRRMDREALSAVERHNMKHTVHTKPAETAPSTPIPLPPPPPKPERSVLTVKSVSTLVTESEGWADAKLAELEHRPHGPEPWLSYRSRLQRFAAGKSYLSSVSRNNYAQEDCLVDNWVSTGRSVFLDLTAGPANWGPIVGGEGIRSPHSFPRVDTFASLHGTREYRANHPLPPGVSESENDDIYHDESEESLNQPKDSDADITEKVDAFYDWDTIEAERLVDEEYVVKNCKVDHPAGSQQFEACKAARAKLAEVEAFIRSHKPGTKVRPESFEGRSAFSFFNDGFQRGHDFNIESDHFLSHLSASLSDALFHAITPATAQHAGPYAKTVNFHLYVLTNHERYDPLEGDLLESLRRALDPLRLPGQEFLFALHRLSMADDPQLSMAYSNSLKAAVVPSLHLDGQFAAIKRLYLDSSELQHELLQVSHAKHKQLHNKPHAKPGAAGAAKPSAAAKARPSPPVRPLQGRPSVKHAAHKRKARRHPHKKRHVRADAHGGHAPHHAHSEAQQMHHELPQSRDIPIFLFSLAYPLPVFIDKHYQARALDNMVVAVQSSQHTWESHVACNAKPIFWNLRSPVRAIVASVAQLLGGLIPQHLTHSVPHNRTAQSWLWATGISPLAHTSHAHSLTFSALQRDALHRNYVLNAIRQATHTVNEAVLKLAQQRTTLGNQVLRMMDFVPGASLSKQVEHDKVLKPHLKHVQHAYQLIRGYLAKIYQDVGDLDFATAVRRLKPLLKYSHRFSHYVDVILRDAAKYECANPTQDNRLGSGWYLMAGIVCVAAVLHRLIWPSKNKMKIN